MSTYGDFLFILLVGALLFVMFVGPCLGGHC